jgi:Arc/MetJ-type ribon-helix-helix transcriptional regulator
MGHGHQGRGLGSEVSKAATEAAHMTKQEIEDGGFRNRGEAVSTAVHEAQQRARDGEAADEDAEAGSPDETAAPGTPTAGTGTTTTTTRP